MAERRGWTRVSLSSFARGVWLMVDEPTKGWGSAYMPLPDTCRKDLHAVEAQVVHAISDHRGGEIRGYLLVDGVAHLRTPASPLKWAELDLAVQAALGLPVQPEPRLALEKPSRCPGGQCACHAWSEPGEQLGLFGGVP